ncbi:MAG TPA: helix-turn-helix domain-containing protein [Mycobacterium sp.]|jgi:excisionase family DNA binding protein|nr:helix-turn-helix domain-containing protein [Mycobacterium sp.]
MTSQEVAERLCMSNEWLRKKVQRREVPFVRLGRYVRFTESHLAEIIASATQPVSRTEVRGSARTKL